MTKYRILLDPPIHAKEFGEWSGDPNVALKDKHDYVQIEVHCHAIESMMWFQNLVQEYTISINSVEDDDSVEQTE